MIWNADIVRRLTALSTGATVHAINTCVAMYQGWVACSTMRGDPPEFVRLVLSMEEAFLDFLDGRCSLHEMRVRTRRINSAGPFRSE